MKWIILAISFIVIGAIVVASVGSANQVSNMRDVVHQAKVAEAESVVQIYQVRLDNVLIHKKQVVAKLEWAEANLKRTTQLYKTNACSRQEYEDAQLKYKQALSDYQESHANEARALLEQAKCRKKLVELGVWPPVWIEK